MSRIPKEQVEVGRLLQPPVRSDEGLPAKPTTRADCANVPRPCPFVSCRHHLYLDVSSAGNVRLNFPDLDPHELPADRSCALDVAEQGGATLETVGAAMNLTRERARQIEVTSLRKARRYLPILGGDP